ncbi:Conserved oligomeric Golgi complex subunit 1 [Lamellibrachia satsuma]|nr:Conserved oligomeric Golgi complex subunit 1 [Lamellibrachia satsuma]
MADHVRGNEMDTGALFEKYTIEEIRDIEKRTRQEIERKKEELRQMVGERYRDLIEAADTITEMKNSAKNVVKSVLRMQLECQKKRDLARVKGTTDKKDVHRKKEASFYAIAAQMKLLMDIPEQIWSAIELGEYLHATQLFLLARHVHTGLQLDTQQSARILSSFPVLTRQWAAIGHFRTTILQDLGIAKSCIGSQSISFDNGVPACHMLCPANHILRS